jgi:hypothetical protein
MIFVLSGSFMRIMELQSVMGATEATAVEAPKATVATTTAMRVTGTMIHRA